MRGKGKKDEEGLLLVMDVGNTQTVLGVYKDEELLVSWRLSTDLKKTPDEYGIMFKALFQGASLEPRAVNGLCISSVVPPLQGVLEEIGRSYFSLEPFFIEPGVKTGLSILYDNPREVGADRIVNAVAALHFYGGPLIVVDFGTATTFCSITKNAEYLGGVIVPGIMISAEALFQRAARLPRVELAKPERVIGKDTVSSIQSGLIYGYTDLVDGIIRRVKAEMKSSPQVVATGGLAEVIAPLSSEIHIVDQLLTLKGLQILYKKNRK